MEDRLAILNAIADVIERSSIYTESKGTVEVERLYLLTVSLDEFVQMFPLSAFEANDKVTQEDRFYDVRLGPRWQLADTDHCVRIRSVRGKNGSFVKAEIKVAYPGPLSNPNARYSPAEKLTNQVDAEEWMRHLEFLGFQVEREYRKERVPFSCEKDYSGFEVELEADQFTDDPCNGPLSGRSFVSLSIETEGDRRTQAEQALGVVRRELQSAGIELVECKGNYEDYFYGREVLLTG